MRAGPLSRRLWCAAGLLLALSGCGFDPEGDVPLEPPAVYREWWAKTQACSGLTGDFDRIRWSDHHIFLASEWSMDEMVVRHEMLHDLIGRPGHPTPPFGRGCPLTWETWNGGAAGLNVARHGSSNPPQLD